MPYLVLLALVYLAAVFQTSLAPLADVRGATPNLLLLIAVGWLLTQPARQRLGAAALVGLASDLTSGGRLGLGVAAYALLAEAVLAVQRKLDLRPLPLRLLLTWLAATAVTLVEALVARLLDAAALPWPTLLGRCTLVGIYTAGVALPVWMVLGWIEEARDRHDVAKALVGK
jgi:rod shape-determining protein MreD